MFDTPRPFRIMENAGKVGSLGIPLAPVLYFFGLPYAVSLVIGLIFSAVFVLGRWGVWKYTLVDRMPVDGQVSYEVSRLPLMPVAGGVSSVDWRVWATGLGVFLGQGRGALLLGPYRVEMRCANWDGELVPGEVVYEVFEGGNLLGRKTVGGGLLGDDFEYWGSNRQIFAVRRGPAFYDLEGREVGFVRRELRFLGSRRVLWIFKGGLEVFFLADVVLDNWADWWPSVT